MRPMCKQTSNARARSTNVQRTLTRVQNTCKTLVARQSTQPSHPCSPAYTNIPSTVSCSVGKRPHTSKGHARISRRAQKLACPYIATPEGPKNRKINIHGHGCEAMLQGAAFIDSVPIDVLQWSMMRVGNATRSNKR